MRPGRLQRIVGLALASIEAERCSTAAGSLQVSAATLPPSAPSPRMWPWAARIFRPSRGLPSCQRVARQPHNRAFISCAKAVRCECAPHV